jgi:flagellar basal body-associated protein FliL
MKKFKRILVVMTAIMLLLCQSSILAYAEDETTTTYTYATDEQKDHIRGLLNQYYSDIKLRYNLTDEKKKSMDKIYNSAMSYMENASLTYSELTSYESTIEGYLKDILNENTSSTEKFLMLSNEVPILSASYNEQTYVVLSLINLGKNDITDVVITPTVSNDRSKWPFNIEQAYDAQCIQIIQASDTTEEAYNKRMDVGWYFTVRSDVLTGCYPLTFHATYYQNGSLAETDITTYINIKGSDPDKLLIKDTDEDENTYNPRIIVTGYTTDPETIYAGSIFNLTVSVKNTSSEVAVENVLFNMEATVEGTDSTSSYSAFLPTSGSNSVYVDKIGPGQTYEMSIEMEAKSDLSQKPYVLKVNMKYDVDKQQNLTDSANVSIPIKQEAKIDTGAADVMPNYIAVGEQSNVMFSVYNTGKTTLYNVKVTFESDTVDDGMTYLGNIAPGATGNVDTMVTGLAPDETGEGIVTAVITYEDESGNETRVEKEINLSVYEESYDEGFDDYYPDDYYNDDTPSSGISVGAIIGIVLAVVVVIVIVIVVIKKKKAKKRKEDELADDEDDL